MLILFDIDATLLKTSGMGIRAMGLAGRELFGEQFNERTVQYAGRLDPLIMGQMLEVHGQPAGKADIARFRGAYRKHLEKLLSQPGVGETCPGVPELLVRLREAPTPRPTLGLLTGNFPETGAIKLRACGVEIEQFEIAAWGDDSPQDPPSRNQLPRVAMARYQQRYGRPIPSQSVTVIGDTPGDIECARVNGCRSLGVATGHFSVDQLMACGADLALPDLSDTDEVFEWLTSAAPAA